MAEMTIQQAIELALAHHRAGRLAEAEGIYRQVLAVDPGQPDALHLLGHIASRVGRHAEAVELVGRALVRAPEAGHIHHTLGNALAAVGRMGEAVAHLARAHELEPGDPEAQNNLANALSRVGRHEEAAGCFAELLARWPELAEAHSNYSIVLKALGRVGEAVRHARRAVELKPGLAEGQNNLANALIGQGRYAESVAARRRALELRPAYVTAHSNLLLELHYQRPDPAGVFAEHLEWARRHGAGVVPMAPATGRESGRKLRVGYVSSDFYAHVVSYFIEPLIRAHDREKFEVYCYSDVVAPDATTGRIAEGCDVFRSIVGMSNQAAAEVVRGDGIDILVDLNGHTNGVRLPMFALRPAPVQMTYLGYPDTTGLGAVDYRLTDVYADPVGMTEGYHTERLLRLPRTAWCYRAPGDLPEVVRRESGEGVTFGCLNALPKLSDVTLDLWAEILACVPGSRLLVKAMGLEDAETREYLAGRLVARGVAAGRFELLGKTRLNAEHLAVYGRIDVALDPYPYHGTTTTCEALLMGVPVVTLAGGTHVSRVGVSLLTNAGLPELVAEGEGEYVRIAAGLAGDRGRLREMHATVRSRFLASPVCDAGAFARDVEAAYERVWRERCEAG